MTSERWGGADRMAGLRRFAAAITLFNILGHTLFGFEQSWAQPLVGVAAAYAVELLLETVEALLDRRRPRYVGGPVALMNFLLSAHITGLAAAMLLYSNDRLWPIAFAAGVAIATKAVIRAPVGQGRRHVFNPSNLGITLTLLLFPSVGIAPPYHYTEDLIGAANWILPAVIVASGTFLNARYTRRIPLLGAWVVVFLAQAVVRNLLFGAPLGGSLVPMTGVTFVLFTFYMVTDPATTPGDRRAQMLFGGGVAAAYGVLMAVHVVFGFFFALTAVSTVRGIGLFARAWLSRPMAALAPAPAATPARPVPRPAASAVGRVAATSPYQSVEP